MNANAERPNNTAENYNPNSPEFQGTQFWENCTRIPLTIFATFINVYWYLRVPDPGGIVASTSSSATWMISSATCRQRLRMLRGSSWQSQLDPLALTHWRQDLPKPCRKYTRGIETKLCTGILGMMRIVICWTLQLASVWRHYANVLP